MGLPPPANEFLLDLVRDAGLDTVRVTSFERTARRQAELMYDLLESVGVTPVREQYESIGDAVVDYYEQNRGRLEAASLIQGMEEVVSAGVRAAPYRQQMMHVLPTLNYTFDVAPSSVAPNEDAFAETIRSHYGQDLVEYILPGPAERAFHLEIPRTLPTVSGSYFGVCLDRAVTVTLTRVPEGYVGVYTRAGQSLPLSVPELDRRTKAVRLESQDDKMAGTLEPGYSALTLFTDREGTAPCRLNRVSD